MSEARVLCRRSSMRFAVLALLSVSGLGCASGLHHVRLRSAEGQARTVTPRVLDKLVGVVPESGLFEELVVVAGTRLVVRGAVIDGIIRVGTIFLAP